MARTEGKILKRGREEVDSDTPTDSEDTPTTTTTTTSDKLKVSDEENVDDEEPKLKKSKPLGSSDKISNILEIVDAKELKYSDFQNKFKEIANQLKNGVILFANGIPHILLELEFYYKSQNHPDKFTHCDVFQKDFGCWYFHRSGTTYRSGTYKGLDITFGSKNDDIYAGILIRAVEQIGEKVVDGPSLVVDHLLKITDHPDISDFVKVNGRSLYEGQNSKLYLKMREDCTEAELKSYKLPGKVDNILECGRVGLTLKRYFVNAEYYISRNYRFLRHPEKIAKGKPYMIISELQRNKSQETIKKQLKTTANSVKNIKEQYEAGKKMTSNSTFKADLSKDLLPQLFGYASTLTYKNDDDNNKTKKKTTINDDNNEEENQEDEENEDDVEQE